MLSDPTIRQQMLIRESVQRVFRAFVDPEITTKFWFTHSSGSLESGASVEWEWRMYGVRAPVRVLDFVEDSRIVIEWGEGTAKSTVQWDFQPRPDGTTMVSITNHGFVGAPDDIFAVAVDSMGGFSFVLAAAKAYLEHGLQLNLVADKAPEAHVPSDGGQ